MKRFLLLIIIVAGESLPAMAQADPGLRRAAELLKSVDQLYKSKPLAFTVKFTYSNEQTPEKILDSLLGWIEMDGCNYRYLLDNTETITNAKYRIILFRDDMIMHLSAAGKSGDMTVQDPVSLSLAMLEKVGVTGCQVGIEGWHRTLLFSFREMALYKQVGITIDTVANRITAMQYIVRTTTLMAPGEDQQLPEGYGEYAIVKAVFCDYRQIIPSSDRFNEHSFFFKEGNTFKPVADYSDYKIFVATPNL